MVPWSTTTDDSITWTVEPLEARDRVFRQRLAAGIPKGPKKDSSPASSFIV